MFLPLSDLRLTIVDHTGNTAPCLQAEQGGYLGACS